MHTRTDHGLNNKYVTSCTRAPIIVLELEPSKVTNQENMLVHLTNETLTLIT